MNLEQPYRPLIARALNMGGRFLEWTGFQPVQLGESLLLEQACQRTGLRDFGDDSFREPLRALLQSYETESNLNLIGRIAARQDTLQLLVNRLQLEEDRKQYPEIAQQEIQRPLFIVGLPRSGTTLLHNLLAQDPANRVPMTWEVMFPSPPPDQTHYESDRRIERAERQLSWFGRLAPDFKIAHPLGARLPQECIAITSHTFASLRFHTTYNIPSYHTWCEPHFMRLAYAYHRRFLQHLQCYCPGQRWVLKSPAHLFGLEALFESYPDARIIQTHRDPTQVMASLASLSAMLYGAFSDHVDLAGIGVEVTRRWARGLEHAMWARDRMASVDKHFYDLHYNDLIRDPIAAVRRIYTYFGLTLTEEAEGRMRRFLTENPKDKYGKHRYSLTQFGLDPEEESRRFQSYRERFGVELRFV